jgi:Cu/Ag efflux protein CusF
MTYLILLFSGIISAGSYAAQSGQVILNGRVKHIDLAAKEIVVTDYEGKDTKLSVEDESILDKFRDFRIKVGDDVNVKYNFKDGKNVPFSFRKLAGC